MSFLIIIGFFSIIIFVWSTIKIYIFLKEKGKEGGNFIFINLFIFKNLNEYKRITKSENGKIGYLYYAWIISINLALLCCIMLLLTSPLKFFNFD